VPIGSGALLGGDERQNNMANDSKMTQCAEQSGALGQELERLDKMVNVLSEKLMPVRCQRSQVDELKKDGVSPALAPLAQFIRDRRDHAARIGEMLNTLITEVEC